MNKSYPFFIVLLACSAMILGCSVVHGPDDSLAIAGREGDEVERAAVYSQESTGENDSYVESELDRALQRLVDDLELAVLGISSSPVDENGPGGTHVVQPGEYLDLIIEKTLPESPVREDLLRRAFVKLNPNAFGGNGNPNYLFAKQKLKIPSVDDLREVIFKTDQLDNLKNKNRDPNNGWIQYP